MGTDPGAQHYGVFIALIEIVASLRADIRNGALVNARRGPLDMRRWCRRSAAELYDAVSFSQALTFPARVSSVRDGVRSGVLRSGGL